MKWMLAFLFLCNSAFGAGITLLTTEVTMPTPSKNALNKGYVELNPRTNKSAVRMRIPANGGNPWTVFVRAKTTQFLPQHHGKQASDLLWKLNENDESTYQALTTFDEEVFTQTDGSKVTLKLDLRMMVDWSTLPDDYTIELVFTLQQS